MISLTNILIDSKINSIFKSSNDNLLLKSEISYQSPNDLCNSLSKSKNSSYDLNNSSKSKNSSYDLNNSSKSKINSQSFNDLYDSSKSLISLNSLNNSLSTINSQSSKNNSSTKSFNYLINIDNLINLIKSIYLIKSTTKTNNKISKLLIFTFIFLINFELNNCNSVYHFNETKSNELEIEYNKAIVCKSPVEKRWFNLFARSYLEIDNVNAIQKVYIGNSVEEVEESMSKWLSVNYFLFFTNSSIINVKLYTDYCVGFKSSDKFKIKLINQSFNINNFLLFLIGVCLFYSSNYLSKKIFIYYASHVTISMLGSLLILVFILYKFTPRRSQLYFAISSLFLNSWFLFHIKQYLFTYPYGFYLFIYLLTAATVGFSFSYYKGPIKNHRYYDLFKWCLQLCSLVIIYLSSEYFELNLLIITIILLNYNLPILYRFKQNVIRNYRTYFPKPRKLLTEKEYVQEGLIETEKALEELRNYCVSPEFNKWKALKKMKDASRFASFIDGEDHVSNDEIFEHVSYLNSSEDDEDLTDDEINKPTNFNSPMDISAIKRNNFNSPMNSSASKRNNFNSSMNISAIGRARFNSPMNTSSIKRNNFNSSMNISSIKKKFNSPNPMMLEFTDDESD